MQRRVLVVLTAALVSFAAPVAARCAHAPNPAPTVAPAEPINGPFQLFPLAKLRYYFQANTGGKGTAQYRATFGHADRRHHNQFNIYIPIETSYAANRPPKTGLGNVSLYVGHVINGERFSHTLAGEVWLPTVTNGVRSNDTEIRPHYDVRWLSANSSLTIQNTFAQSIIVPPGSKWTSYYDFEMAAAPHTRATTLALYYEGRFLFTQGGTYASTIGPEFVGQQRDNVRLSLFDIWGVGASGQTNLWRYKFQANLTAKL